MLTKLNIRRNYRSQGWKFTGTIDENNLRTLCIEENIDFDDFIRVTSPFELMREYPEVFGIWADG